MCLGGQSYPKFTSLNMSMHKSDAEHHPSPPPMNRQNDRQTEKTAKQSIRKMYSGGKYIRSESLPEMMVFCHNEVMCNIRHVR